jgi:L-lactate dehydrogenase complex protein LldE
VVGEVEAMGPRVGLFVTCLVDLLRPSVGFAAVRLLEAAGCRVEVPCGQTCCGQPAFNAGARADAKELAAMTVRAFAPYDYVVAPSGSCAAMLKLHYPRLVAGEGALEAEVRAFAERVHELVSFLVHVRRFTRPPGKVSATVVYHDGCSGLRELGMRDEPRTLLGAVEGLELLEMGDSESCCGFGGLFCVKYPDISDALAEKKQAAIEAANPDLVVSGDLGCLLQIAGKLRRAGSPVRCRHVAEVLAGELADPPMSGAP